MNTRKLSSSKLPVVKSKQNTSKQFTDSKCSKSESQLIIKTAEPFISYKSQQSHQTEINIAGYKTVGSYVNLQKTKNNSEEYTISKQSIEKYLFTFCFEIGCDLPSEEEIKLIYTLLLAHSRAGQNDALFEGQAEHHQYQSKRTPISNKKYSSETINKLSLYLLIRLCLEIYIKSKKSNIGGILERLIIGIRKEIQVENQEKQNTEQYNLENQQ